MKTNLSIVRELAEKWLNGTITEEEKVIFEKWYNTNTETEIEWFGDTNREVLKESQLAAILAKIEQEEQRKVVIKLPRRRHFARLAAASVILLAVGAGMLLYMNRKKPDAIARQQLQQDIKAPKTARAVISLPNGKQIFLDSAPNGNLLTEGNLEVRKLADGQIAYEGTPQNAAKTAMEYHTLTVPRGSKVVDLMLNDGTHVWLNAESSLRFPVAFTGTERKVTITGEAYFEVAKDPSKKFIVQANGFSTEVLGTHFNINSYNDDGLARITLLEGSIKVSKAGANTSVVIKPGEQAQVGNGVSVINDADINEVMAWKNGKFEFNGASLETVMLQVERWYDVKVEYKGTAPALNFMGGGFKAGKCIGFIKDT